MHILVDGPILAYSAFYHCCKDGLDIKGDWENEGEHFYPLFVSSFIRQLVSLSKTISRGVRPDRSSLAIIWEGVYGSEPRRRLFADYKKHRSSSYKEGQQIFPGHFIGLLKDDLQAVCPRYALHFPLLEGDDLIAYICDHSLRHHRQKVCIVSPDKDFLQLINNDVIVASGSKGIYDLITAANAVNKTGLNPSIVVEYKALVGDPSDGYKGVPGVGPKKAQQYFNSIAAGGVSQYHNEEGYRQGMLLAKLPFPAIEDHEDFNADSLQDFLAAIDFDKSPDWYIIEEFISDDYLVHSLGNIQ